MGSHPSFDQVNKITKKELNSAAKFAIKTEVAYVRQMPLKPVQVGVKNAKAKAKELMSTVQNQKFNVHIDYALTTIRL